MVKEVQEGKINKLNIQYVETLSPEETLGLSEMQHEVFGFVVDEKEVYEDFINKPYAHILLKDADKIVGNLDLHRSTGSYDGKDISIGGLGIGILKSYRGYGYGGKLISLAMQHLKKHNFDIGFLAAAPGTIPLYEKYGWEVLKVPYNWENIHGEIKSDNDGMITALNNTKLVDEIQKGVTPLFIGKGYW